MRKAASFARCLRGLAVAAGTLGVIAAAQADPTRDALQRFGLIGTWAVDCSRQPSLRNPHQIYRAPGRGSPTRTLVMQDKSLDGTFAMTNVQLVAPDKLTYRDTKTATTVSYDIVLSKKDNRLRSLSSVRTDGTVLIRDGKFVSGGAPTLEFERCKVQ